ncbi:hypothetical protein O181_113425 [Austropuccinia psidii MF-1]|uniref:Uncharacterized protein n=1 Tax=Austropuccinia psidii MF-1 TaxID=1389203 RepID=A0A9Q3PUI4_9BASI|nr:hypothetical protein [Austropuccinia psidii MF-1]
MPQASHYFLETSIPQSNRTINKILHPIIPLPTSAISRSIHQLCWLIMEINYFQSPSDINSWKSLPSEESLKIVENLPFSCTDNPITNPHNHNSGEDRPSINPRILISPMYKTMFLEDLFKSGFPMSTFAWNQCWESNICKICSQALELFTPTRRIENILDKSKG